MKKVILIASMLLAFAGFSFAQTTTPAKPAAATTTHTKKDGTPDKRFKENKTAAAPATTHTKKDGTPDKRYKENKTPAKKG
jgi:hypothetical protein